MITRTELRLKFYCRFFLTIMIARRHQPSRAHFLVQRMCMMIIIVIITIENHRKLIKNTIVYPFVSIDIKASRFYRGSNDFEIIITF